MTLSAGIRLGPYEILSPLGAGGMGEVYRARDTRLGREVAIKVLPSHLSSSPETRQRFEREAKTISQLSHPHICALYDVGQEGETEYLVMELLEGETLSDRLGKGPLPLEQTVRYGSEIADALARAHRKGIVHRDLKPSNIMLTKSGVKLLDFGLAKAMAPAAEKGSLTSLPTQQGLTQEGTILGTFQYMAPEQLEGKEADGRTDIFALGAVLYEMVTGKKAFSGSSQASLISSIMTAEPPPISTLQPMSPPALDRLVKTCLSKDPEDRWQSAGDVGKELRWIADGSQAGHAAATVPRRARTQERLAWTTAGLLALATLYLVLSVRNLRSRPTTTIHSFLEPPAGTAFRLTGDDGGPMALSPDGEHMAFRAGERIWVESLRTGASEERAGTDGGRFPFWSPDSRSIGFFSDGKLRVIDVSGGPVRTICAAANPRGGTWSAGGVIVFSPDVRAGLQRVAASGGEPVLLTRVDEKVHTTHRWPFFLPDGKHVLYLAANHRNPHSDAAGIYVASLDGKESRRLISSYGSAQYSSGWLLSVRDTSLMAQRFDPRSLTLSGEPVRIADGVNFDEGVWRGVFTTSENGLLAYQLGEAGIGGQLTWMDALGRRIGTVGERSIAYALRLSPNGRRASVIIGDPSNDVWIYELERNVRTRLTTDAQVTMSPQWSADGSLVLFTSQVGVDAFPLETVPANGGGDSKILYRSKERIESTDWSRDGRYVLVDRGNIGATDVWAIPLAEPDKAFPIVSPPAYRTGGQFSPDGRWVAYNSRESGRVEVYVTSFPGRGARWQVSASGGAQPRWSQDGKELYFVAADGQLMAASVETVGSRLDIRDVRPLFRTTLFTGPRMGAHGYDISPDGKRFLINSASETGGARVILVSNWDVVFPK
jgi:Tol biopolymer transport system component